MFELVLLLFICVCTWLAIHTAQKPRRKRKSKQPRLSIVEQLFGYPLYLWLCLKLWPGKVSDEMMVTIQTEGKKNRTKKTLQYIQRDSGLCAPAR